MAGRMAERWYRRLSGLLNHDLRGRQPLILYASGPHFRQTNAIEGSLGEGTGGVTEALRSGGSSCRSPGRWRPPTTCIGHELVHAFQYDITNTERQRRRGQRAVAAAVVHRGHGRVPLDRAGRRAYGDVDAGRRRSETSCPTIDDLDDPRYFPYRYGQALWAYIGGRYGDRTVGSCCAPASDAAASTARLRGRPRRRLPRRCRRSGTPPRSPPIAPIAEATTDAGRPFAQSRDHRAQHGGGDMNVSPELSPDGSRLMFFSERDLFSIDLYLADARTGKVIRKVTDTATDAHFREPAVPDVGRRLGQHRQRASSFPGISRRRPILTIVDADSGRTESGDRRCRSRRSPQSDLVARRQPDRLLRAGRRPQRPVRVRSRQRRPAPADQRRLRRARPRLVAGRPAASRSAPTDFRPTSTALTDRRPPAGGDGRCSRTRRARPAASASRQEHQPAVGPGRPRPVLPLGPSAASRTSIAWPRRGGATRAADQHPDRRQRHHGAQPGPVGGRGPDASSAPTRRTATASTRSDQADAAPAAAWSRWASCRSTPRSCRRARSGEGPSTRRCATIRGSACRRAADGIRPSVSSRGCRSISPGSRRLASAPIPSAPTRPAASRSCSATCSATTVVADQRAGRRAGSTSSAAQAPST